MAQGSPVLKVRGLDNYQPPSEVIEELLAYDDDEDQAVERGTEAG